MQQAMARTPGPTRAYCSEAAANLVEWLRGPASQVPRPPRVWRAGALWSSSPAQPGGARL
eukprot:7966984-Lingulodinium_polyedra.AAC.1